MGKQAPDLLEEDIGREAQARPDHGPAAGREAQVHLDHDRAAAGPEGAVSKAEEEVEVEDVDDHGTTVAGRSAASAWTTSST